MILSNQAAFSGKLDRSPLIMLTNTVLVDLVSEDITIEEYTCSHKFCCCQKITIEIENNSEKALCNCCLTNLLPCDIVKIIPCSLLINNKLIEDYSFRCGLLAIPIDRIAPNEKIVVEFGIARRCYSLINWCYFENQSQLRVDENIFSSNCQRIYNCWQKDFQEQNIHKKDKEKY